MERDAERDRILLRTSWVSTIGNSLLSAAKIAVGVISGSLAVLGDGIDSATDVVISIVMIFTARIIRKKPSAHYVYSYQKAEGIATMVLSLVIFYAGIQMLITSVGSIFSDDPKQMPGVMAIYVTAFSIVGKLLLALYQFRKGRKIGSSMLVANAKNMRADVIISASVLVGLFFTFILKLPILDSVTGLVVSFFIIRTSVNIFIDSNVELMDGVKDVTIYNKIFDAVDRVPGASNPHRVRTRNIGNLYIIALDIEVDGSMSIEQGHEIAGMVEESIKGTVENVYDIVVHVEPSGVKHAKEQFGLDKRVLDKD